MVIAHLEVSSWRGISIGAVHWYCELIVEDGTDTKYIKMVRPLTAKEVAVMNKERRERGYTGHHSVGEATEGFITEQEAIKAGIDFFSAHYKGVLFDSGHTSCSAWKKVIIWQPQFAPSVNKMNTIADIFQGFNGYECEKKNMKLVEKLDGRWYKLYVKLQKLCKTNV